MTLTRLPRPLYLLGMAGLVLPLALGLAACKKSDSTGSSSGDPVAAVAPPAGKAWTDVVKATPEGGMVMGNPAAPIKLVEYGSLSCPHCAKFAAAAADGKGGCVWNGGERAAKQAGLAYPRPGPAPRGSPRAPPGRACRGCARAARARPRASGSG